LRGFSAPAFRSACGWSYAQIYAKKSKNVLTVRLRGSAARPASIAESANAREGGAVDQVGRCGLTALSH
jgi:hypothetical protein